MSSRNTVRRMLGAAVLAVAIAAAAQAQSPWKALAQAIAPDKKQTAQQQPQPADKPQETKMGMVNDPALGVTHGYAGVKPDTELAAAEVRGALSTLKDKLPSFGGGDKNLDFGSELDETTSTLAINLFQNPEIRKLLGDSPRFVYDPAGKSDPMVVPWVRRAAIIKELLARADQHLAAGNADQAVAIYKKVLDMRDQRFVGLIQQKLDGLAKLQQVDAVNLAKTQAAQTESEKVELPAWVQDNTVGVLLDKKGAKEGLCLVGEYMLRIGEAIPTYPDVTVAAIGEKSVTYLYRSQAFSVELNGDMANKQEVRVLAVTKNSAKSSYRNRELNLQRTK